MSGQRRQFDTRNTHRKGPSILTTTVGSYPVPQWLVAAPCRQSLIDATRVVFDIQRQAGVDLPTDGELYRFDTNHPDTNGMIDYFVRPLQGVRSDVGRRDFQAYAKEAHLSFRTSPAGVVEGPLFEGALNLLADCQRAASVAGGPFKFTVTSPYMLARTLVNKHYESFDELVMALAQILADQVRDLPCDCVQVDEANLVGNPQHAPIAAAAINRVLDSLPCQRAVHLCFGNYGGQTIQQGDFAALINFLNELHADHLVLEVAHRPAQDLTALREINPSIALGIGVIDIKVNTIESADEVAARIEKAEKVLGSGRVKWVHPDCGFWMLHRQVVDRKIEALVEGRNTYLGM